MKRGMVIKINNDYAFIATDDADFIKIKLRENMKVGQKIYVLDEDIIGSKEECKKHLSTSKFFKVAATIAACILIVMMSNNLFIRDTQPLYAMVSLDINPSFQLGIDASYNVVQINAMNEESKAILNLELMGQPLSVAVSNILCDIEKSGYQLPSENTVLISMVNFKDESDEPLQNSVVEGVYLAISENVVYEDIEVIFIKADEEDLEAAKEQELSLGKYRLLEMSDYKIDKTKIMEGRVSDLIKEEEIKDDLRTDNTIQIIKAKDLQEFNQIEEDTEMTYEEEEESGDNEIDDFFDEEECEDTDIDNFFKEEESGDNEIDNFFEEKESEDIDIDNFFKEEEESGDNEIDNFFDKEESEDINIDNFFEKEESEDINIDNFLEEEESEDNEIDNFFEEECKDNEIDDSFKEGEESEDDEFYNSG